MRSAENNHALTRRQALAALAGAGLALALPPVSAAAKPEKLRLAFFGVGGRGRANVANLAGHVPVAFADVDGVLLVPEMRVMSRPRILPAKREQEFLAAPPRPTLPRPKGGHHEDWVQAILQNRPAAAPFGYGAELTEKVLLGTLAQRTTRPVRWQREKMRCVDNPEADALVTPVWRPGWEWLG